MAPPHFNGFREALAVRATPTITIVLPQLLGADLVLREVRN